MVKKISGPGGPRKAGEVSSVTGASSVDRASELKGVSEVAGVSEVSGVKQVSSVSGVGGMGSISGLGQRITPDNQAEVFKTIDAEAEKMFAGKRIPRQRQKTITDALKMAVMAATVKEDEEEK